MRYSFEVHFVPEAEYNEEVDLHAQVQEALFGHRESFREIVQFITALNTRVSKKELPEVLDITIKSEA